MAENISYTGIIKGNDEQVEAAVQVIREVAEKAMAGDFYPVPDREGVTNLTYLGVLAHILAAMDVEWKVES